jgi:hypothetical protein
MSKEFKAPRPVSEVQSEYSSLCMKAGHVNYQLFTLSNDLKLINEQLRDLNLEAAASQKFELEAKAKAEAEKKAQEQADKPSLAVVPSEEK